MKRVTIFCGSSAGNNPKYVDVATQLGQTLATENIGVIYGGANIGLMGAVADGALSKGGEVIGILPIFLQEKEIAHQGLTRLILVTSMHERKTQMNALCDGVIMLPGGFGTLEEFFEMLTWGQLGLHQKPIGLLNVDGFYDDLLSLMQSMVDKGFLKAKNHQMVLVSDTIDELLVKMRNYEAPKVQKWIKN